MKRFLPLFLLPSLAACGADFSSLVPTVKFKEFAVKDLDFEHIDTDFVFTIDNPNPIGTPLSRFAYELAFEQIPFLSGDDPSGLALEANGTSDVALPVSLTFEHIYEIVQAVKGEDDIAWGLDGAFGFDTDLGPVDITYGESGEFPALRVPKLQLGKLKLVNGDDSSETMDLEIDFDVSNEHGSAIGLGNLEFNMALNGDRVGGGVVEEVGEIEGATTKSFVLPFSINYVDAIEAVWDAAQNGQKMDVNLDAALDVDTPFGIVPLTVDETGDLSVFE